MTLRSAISAAAWETDAAARRLRYFWRELDRFQHLPAQVAKQKLARRLLAQLRYFGGRGDALLEWKESTSIKAPEDLWRIWPHLPILTKHDLQTRFRPEEMQRRFGLKGRASSTGGSTGEPTPYFHDREMLRATSAASRYCRMKMGWRPGMPTICIWGSERDIGKRLTLIGRVYSWLRNEHLVDGYSLDRSTVARVLRLVRRHPAVAIYGFSSMLEFVARQIVEDGDLPPAGRVRAAWNGGEMLFENQIELFRRAFGVPILNLYGGRELSAMAYQPREGAELTVLRPFLLVEIVRDDGTPARPGETGRLIWTSTVCRGTPFLRYDTGDVGCYSATGADESGIRSLKELQGRHAGLLKLPDSRIINNIYWNHLFKDFPEVQQFQVALVKGERVHLRLKGTGFKAESEARLRRLLMEFLGPTPVEISWVEKIPLTPQGKLVQVVREE